MLAYSKNNNINKFKYSVFHQIHVTRSTLKIILKRRLSDAMAEKFKYTNNAILINSAVIDISLVQSY